jgi:TatD DNase family protein
MIDSHCHLDFDDFDGERDSIIGDARGAGVHTIINIGIDIPTSEYSIRLAERFDCVYATVGMHPSSARSFDKTTIESFRKLAQHKKVVAIGEIGLDYYRDRAPRPLQREVFQAHLALAAELNLPVVIHTREAFDDSVEIVKDFAGSIPGGTFHCFPGDADQAHMVFEMGFVISVGGVITYKNSLMSKMVAEVPLDKVLLETDAPFLTPHPNRGKRNSPGYIPLICRKLAELKQVSEAEVEKVTDRTCQKLFKLVETFGG